MFRTSHRIAFLLGLIVLAPIPSTLWAQAALNANPLDPFPANVQALVKLSESNKSIADAIQSFASGNAEKLREDLTEAKKQNPDFPQSDVMLARLFMANQQWAESLTVLESHLAANRSDAEAYKSLAEIAMVSGRWTDAWLQLEKAGSLVDAMRFSDTRKQNFVIELTRLRAETAEQRKDTTIATQLFEDLAKQQPKDGYPLWSLGRLKIAAGDLDAGVELLKKGKQITPSLPQPELAMALELSGGEDRSKAEKWFKDGILAKDTATQANWVQYLRFLLNEDRAAEAKALITKAPADYQSSRDLKLIKAVAHRYLNEFNEAEQILSELNRANPEDLEVADQLALTLVESTDEGKRARAGQISEANLRQAQNVEQIVATAAWIKFRTGSLDVADNILGQVIRGGRMSPQTAYYSAMLLKARGNTEEAKQFFQAAVNAPGSFPQKKAVQAELARATTTTPK